MLEKRRPEERFSLIRCFFCTETQRGNKTFVIASEILIALLLYPCPGQVKQLKNDIKIACANAYVREYQSGDSQIQLIMYDFPYNIRTGLLNFKKNLFNRIYPVSVFYGLCLHLNATLKGGKSSNPNQDD